MDKYIELVEKLSDHEKWDRAIFDYCFDIGAMGVEKWQNDTRTMAEGIAIDSELVKWRKIRIPVMDDTEYRIFTKPESRLQSEDEAVRFLKGLYVLVHDHDQLRKRSIRDEKSNALNKKGLEEWFAWRTRYGPHGMSFVFIWFDFDNFKQLNDTQGHAKGDEAIRAVVQELQGILRATDVVVRLGGDEFVLVMDNMPYHENVKNRLEEIASMLPLDKYNLTMTMGVVWYPIHGTNLETLLDKADQAMYQGKKSGKNKIVLWEEGMGNDPAGSF